jgi:VWFA-related protein
MLFRLLSLLAFLALSSAQQSVPADEFQLTGAVYSPPSQNSLKAESRLVEVGVVVRDSKGHTVAGLTRDDFEIEDSGRKQNITAFSVQSGRESARSASAERPSPATAVPPAAAQERPRFIVLAFDDFSMTASELTAARLAAGRFLHQGLGNGDLAAIFTVSQGQALPFTSDTSKLEEALNRLTVRTRDAGMATCPYISSYEALEIMDRSERSVLAAKIQEAINCGLCQGPDAQCTRKIAGMARVVWDEARDTSHRTLLFLDSVVNHMANLPGRRVIVLASSGFLSRTLERDRESVIDRALRSEVVINALDAKGLFTQDMSTTGSHVGAASLILRQSLGTHPQMEANDSLAILAESTGGLFFHNNNDLAVGFQELGLAPEFSYSLGFSPSIAPDDQFHALKVRLKAKGHYSMQARPGYFASVIPPSPPAPERTIDKAVLSTDTAGDVPAELIAVTPVTQNNRPALHVVLRLDTQRLPFAEAAGIRHLQMTIIAAIFDERSVFATGQEAHAVFAFRDETYQRFRNGFHIGLTLAAPPGKYGLRCVIQEDKGGKITSILRPVEIP